MLILNNSWQGLALSLLKRQTETFTKLFMQNTKIPIDNAKI